MMIWVWLVVAATVELEVRMVHIDWRRLPDRPLGTQDSAAGIIDDDFVIIAGNRGRQGTPAHAGQAGMYTGGQSLSISNPQLGWSNVTSVPATTADGKRLGFSTGSTASIPLPNGMGSGLAFAGGFSHTNCSRQVFVMMKTVAPAYGKFGYERLPDLPWDIAEANLVAVGSTLYSIGGADCGLPPNTERFLTWSDRWGGNKGFGTRVLSLDLSKCPLWRVDLDSDSDGANAKFDCQWAREADFPGSPRSGATVVAVSGTVYVLGGYSSANTSICAKPPQDCTTIMQPGCLSSPVDNWKMDTTSTPIKWSQLPPRPAADTHPVGDTKGYALWRGRYILSIGVIGRSHALTYPGWQFRPIASDSLLRSAKLNDTCSPPLKGWGSNSYPNGIAVYDTQTNRFGTVSVSSTAEPTLVKPGCPAGLPLNCYSPSVGLAGDSLFVSGGECDPHYVASNANHGGLPHASYWHYPRIVLRGTLSLVNASD